jgi:hypothetical protein
MIIVRKLVGEHSAKRITWGKVDKWLFTVLHKRYDIGLETKQEDAVLRRL